MERKIRVGKYKSYVYTYQDTQIKQINVQPEAPRQFYSIVSVVLNSPKAENDTPLPGVSPHLTRLETPVSFPA